MKPKMIQLLLLFLMVSLFSSSKENNATATAGCKIKYVQQADCALQAGEQTITGEDESAEYPFALAPGNYMFRY